MDVELYFEEKNRKKNKPENIFSMGDGELISKQLIRNYYIFLTIFFLFY